MATRLDIVRRAFRFIGVVADDEAMTAAQADAGSDLLDSIYEGLMTEAPPSFTIEDIPSVSATPLAMVLAADLALQYERPAQFSRGYAMLRLIATIRPDDRAEIVEPEFY